MAAMRESADMGKVWLESYPPGVPAEIDVGEYGNIREIFARSCAKFAALPAFTCMGRTLTYAELDRLSRDFGAWLQHGAGMRARRAGGDHVAQPAPVSGGALRGAARGLRGGQLQPALHAAGARAPAERLGRRGDRDPREFRPYARGGAGQDAGEIRRHHPGGRPPGVPEVLDRQLRGQAREEDGAAVEPSRRAVPSRRARRGKGSTCWTSRRSGTATSPSCSTRGERPASRRAPCSPTATSWRTCCRRRHGSARGSRRAGKS